MAPAVDSPDQSQSRARRALVSVSSVVKVLDATMKRVVSGSRSARRLRQICRVDVRDEARLDAGVRVGLECLVDHHGAEVRSADPDVDDVRHPLARHALPLAAADSRREGAHAPPHRLDVGIDILTVDRECRRSARGSPQRGVEDGAVLGGVDVLAGDHRGIPLRDAGLLGQTHERSDDLARHEVLRQIHVQVGQLEGELIHPAAVVGEPAAQVRGE